LKKACQLIINELYEINVKLLIILFKNQKIKTKNIKFPVNKPIIDQ